MPAVLSSLWDGVLLEGRWEPVPSASSFPGNKTHLFTNQNTHTSMYFCYAQFGNQSNLEIALESTCPVYLRLYINVSACMNFYHVPNFSNYKLYTSVRGCTRQRIATVN